VLGSKALVQAVLSAVGRSRVALGRPSTYICLVSWEARPLSAAGLPPPHPRRATSARVRLSDQLEGWLKSGSETTVGGLIDAFEAKSFALLFILLLGPSALPAPTGGVTNVLEVIAFLAAGQLVIGRDRIWLPNRWRRVRLDGPRRERFISRLLRFLRFLERFSRPRAAYLFNYRPSNVLFGVLVIAFTAGAFLAPPFSGLDTLPALGVVLLSLGMLLEDVLLALLGVAAGFIGVALELLLGKAAVSAIERLL
jgi:hypothetical protein